MSQKLKFKVSSALKNIIGRELINDKLIAIFEIVKNSYDAGATRVDICFENFNKPDPSITIIDNGCGMDYEGIINKWLFVAYSEKKQRNQTPDYRSKFNRKSAGAKGVGRFSCDRLGTKLSMFTKTKSCDITHSLDVNWDKFEEDDKKEFINIDVQYNTILEGEDFIHDSGTVLSITGLREYWNKQDIMDLKKSLQRLVNPDNENTGDAFEIYLSIPDLEISSELITNDVFERLNLKTTNIIVKVSNDGKQIETELCDRGEFIYRIIEKNPYPELNTIVATLFYLNRSAKMTFTKSMGVTPVEYGSVFVYKNNFRIYPYGEEGRDDFKIDRRKQQGYNRYLGTRDIIGRISIQSDDKHFIETSSRNNGFLETPEYFQLQDLFIEKVFKPLEKYVVDIIKWGDVSEEDAVNGKEPLSPKDVVNKIIDRIANISKNSNIISIKCNDDLLNTISQASASSLSSQIASLKKIASKIETSEDLTKIVENVEKKTRELDSERREAAERVSVLTKALEDTTSDLNSEKTRASVLFDALSGDQKDFKKRMHLIQVNIATIRNYIYTAFERIKDKRFGEKEAIKFIKDCSYQLDRIYAISNYGGAAKFNVKDEIISADITQFIFEYCNEFIGDSRTQVQIYNKAKPLQMRFAPQDIAATFENVVSNSKKAGANLIKISMYDAYIEEIEVLCIDILDNGGGLRKYNADPKYIFDFGKSYSGGTGIGLYHVKDIFEKLGGSISVNENVDYGFELQVRIKR